MAGTEHSEGDRLGLKASEGKDMGPTAQGLGLHGQECSSILTCREKSVDEAGPGRHDSLHSRNLEVPHASPCRWHVSRLTVCPFLVCWLCCCE